MERRPITDEAIQKLDQLERCRFVPGSWDKRFVRDVRGLLATARDRGLTLEITERQAEMIDRLRHRYRRQIDGSRQKVSHGQAQARPWDHRRQAGDDMAE